ncbi:MAG: Cache 3/Cache 2 fusion domain-containing protein, partial [Chloroflexi bacterium]|nr:Cache 3/Cache 2 fusion domain-containing protein [Chloroflexota bacterium]
PNLFGVVVCFSPGVYPGKKLYGPYLALNQTGKHDLIQVEDIYDYSDATSPNSVWYQKIIQAGKGQWLQQYGEATQDWVVIYGTPFFRIDAVTGKKTIAGVVAATHSVGTTLKTFMQSIDLGQEGYALLVTDDGKIVHHPNPAVINKTIQNIADMTGDVVLAGAAQRQLQGENFYVERKSINQTASWTTFRVLPTSKWTVVTVVYQNSLSRPARIIFVQFLYLGLALLVGMLGLMFLVFRPDKKTSLRLWATSLTGAILITLCLFWLWYLAYTISLEKREVIINDENVATTIAATKKDSLSVSEAPIQIPTGIMIENISISNNSAKLTGYIWQKYPLNMDNARIIAPRFPDAIGSSELTEVYRFTQHGKLVIGWVFNAELSQHFNFNHYPIDQSIVQLLIEPNDYTINALMVPDFQEYEYMSPSQKPGIQNNLSPVGWEIKDSFFSYVRATYNTTFGGSSNIYINKYPVLAFNIQSERLVLSPVITYGIIICVLLVQIFGLLLFPIEKPTESFSISSALFLVIAITHNTLRAGLDLNGTVYLEYLFIFMYLVVLLVGLISLMRTLNVESKMLSQDALIPKLMFWPTISMVVLIITLVVFYPGA